MKTLSIEKAVAAYSQLAAAKLNACKASEKFVVIKATAALRPIAEKYQSIARDAQERLRPDNWEQLVEQSKRWTELSDADKAAHNEAVYKYNAEVEECLAEELSKEAEVEVGALDEEALGRLLDSNPEWNVAQAEAVIALIGG